MNSKSDEEIHLSVMSDELLSALKDVRLRTFYEGTLGMGGHAKLLLESHPEIESYIGCDRDPQALEIAGRRLKEFEGKLHLNRGSFSDVEKHLRSAGKEKADGFFLT